MAISKGPILLPCAGLRTDAAAISARSYRFTFGAICRDRIEVRLCHFFEPTVSMQRFAGGGCWNLRARPEHKRKSAQCLTASHFDPETTRGSPVGMQAGILDGRPITSGRNGSTTNARPVPYAMNCAIYALATPKSSTSKSPKTTSKLARASTALSTRHPSRHSATAQQSRRARRAPAATRSATPAATAPSRKPDRD